MHRLLMPMLLVVLAGLAVFYVFLSQYSLVSTTAAYNLAHTASIKQIDGHDFPGQLDVNLTFTDQNGGKKVYDIHYPKDFTFHYEGFGPLWMATWRNDMPQNPEITPLIGNTCLQPNRGENLARGIEFRNGNREYLVCRFLYEISPESDEYYNLDKAAPAVIGLLWANRNHQPIDMPRERCVAEALVWANEIAKPKDQFMACVYVVNEQPQDIQVFAFELTEDAIVEVGGNGQVWARGKNKARHGADDLVQYHMMQKWLEDENELKAAQDRAFAHVSENLDQIVPTRLAKFDGIKRKNDAIHFSFTPKSKSEMFRIRDSRPYGEESSLYKHIRKLVCSDDEAAALMAFQGNKPTYLYSVEEVTLRARFPNLPC